MEPVNRETNPQMISESQVPPPAKFNFWLVSTLVLFIALVGVLGYFLWVSKNQNNQKVTDVVSQSSANTPSPFSEQVTSLPSTPTQPDPTADWRKYNNRKYNFSFKYPVSLDPEQTEEELSPSVVVSGVVDGEIRNSRFLVVAGYTWGISQTATGMDAFMSCSTDDDCFKKYYDNTNIFPRKGLAILPSVSINGRSVKGFEYADEGSSGNQLHMYYPLSRNGKFFLVSFNFVNYTSEGIAKNQVLINQILSTFRFD